MSDILIAFVLLVFVTGGVCLQNHLLYTRKAKMFKLLCHERQVSEHFCQLFLAEQINNRELRNQLEAEWIRGRKHTAVVHDQAATIKNMTRTHEMLLDQVDQTNVAHAQRVLELEPVGSAAGIAQFQ